MKVSDGRKTKGKIGAKNEKAKLDKEWNKVRRPFSILKTKFLRLLDRCLSKTD